MVDGIEFRYVTPVGDAELEEEVPVVKFGDARHLHPVGYALHELRLPYGTALLVFARVLRRHLHVRLAPRVREDRQPRKVESVMRFSYVLRVGSVSSELD